MACLKQLDAATLRVAIHYDPISGHFEWLERKRKAIRGGHVRKGKAGCLNADGYVEICVFGKLYRAHRLAWLYMTGAFPADLVDHVNGDRADNSWANLRGATSSQNCANKKANCNSATGLKGVRRRTSGRFQARVVGQDGKPSHIGMYDTAEEAHAAYIEASTKLFGDFARSM